MTTLADEEQTLPVTRIPRAAGLGEAVYEALYNRLMTLALAPGSRITVDALARELGVSQTPIREALSRLEEQGLVIKTHLVGYSAAPQIDARRFEEIYDLRLMIEPEAAARAAERMTDEVLEQLAALAARMKGRGPDDAGGAYSRFARLDAEFHDLILDQAGNSLVREAIARLHIHMHLFRLHYHRLAASSANREHDALLAAFAQRDPARARSAMRRHLQQSRERFVTAFPAGPR